MSMTIPVKRPCAFAPIRAPLLLPPYPDPEESRAILLFQFYRGACAGMLLGTVGWIAVLACLKAGVML